jgi:hypothetical protein
LGHSIADLAINPYQNMRFPALAGKTWIGAENHFVGESALTWSLSAMRL